MRIMALDAGTKRIGAAISDPSQIIAAAIGFVEVNEDIDRQLLKLIEDNMPGKIVVGNPLKMDGSKSDKSVFVQELVERIKKLKPDMEIVMWDERLTTVQAQRVLIMGGMRREKRKETVDKVAAVLILQNYLDYLKHRGGNG